MIIYGYHLEYVLNHSSFMIDISTENLMFRKTKAC